MNIFLFSYDELGNIISISRTTKLQEYVNLPSQINYYYEDTKDKIKITKYVIDGTEFTMTYDSYNNLTKLNNYDITMTMYILVKMNIIIGEKHEFLSG